MYGDGNIPKYKVVMYSSDGTSEEQDEIFDSREDAEEHGCYLSGCSSSGNEILNLSNPGDYPMDEFETVDFDVIEIDE